ncbi:AFG1/ZapE family ATPase [Owenweeksia hongkongensis]|uniref:AFG1/ZapE family ATPase n=1 Tax=Owenweeksia hongkongensis TaxID=253245 RepID=UPI003A942A71
MTYKPPRRIDLREIQKEIPAYQPRKLMQLDKRKLGVKMMEELHQENRLQLTDENENIIHLLLAYFSRDHNFPSMTLPDSPTSFSLYKGIYLYGNPGSGKTHLMEAFMKTFRKLGSCDSVAEDLRFMKYQWDDVSFQIKEKGSTIINTYGKSIANGTDKDRPRNYWFDEYSVKKGIKDFGTPVDMNDIFKLRYELFKDHRVMTHITSNLNPSQLIAEGLPQKMFSRFMEMFNFIPLGAKDDYTDFRVL